MSALARSFAPMACIALLATSSPAASNTRLVTSNFDIYSTTLLGQSEGYGCAVGDLNGDGRDDVVYDEFNWTPGAILCARLQGAGNLLTEALTSTLGGLYYVTAIHLARIDADDDLDAAVASDDTLCILMGNGDGTFGAPISIALPGYSTDVTVGDFDGDGDADLAVARNDSDEVQILLGSGGSFIAGPAVPVGDGPQSCSVFDANGDGDPDLVIGDYTGSVLLLGGPGSSFTASGIGVNLAWPAGDLNGDGFADVVGWLDAALGNGAGGFGAPIPHGMDFPWTTVDLDEDGLLDLVSGQYTGENAVLVRSGNGDGTFGPARTYGTYEELRAIVHGDFDGDGHQDLSGRLSTDIDRPKVVVIRGRGNGDLVQARTVHMPLPTHWVSSGDLDGNGMPDLVASFDGSIGVALANGPASYPTVTTYPGPPAPQYDWIARIATGDLNQDGRADVLAIGGTQFSVWLTNADGTLGARTDRFLGAALTEMAVADLDADGDLDVVVKSSTTAWIFPGNGNETFAPHFAVAEPLHRGIAVADLNGDDYLDLISRGAGGQAMVCLAQGPLNYPYGDAYFRASTGTQWFGVAVGRVDSDPYPDVVLGNSGSVDVYFNQGDGTLGPAQLVTLRNGSTQSSSIRMADIDGDGLDDLVKPGRWDMVLIGLSQGNGTFAPIQRHAARAVPKAIDVLDLNGNGRLDIVSADGGSQTLTLMLDETTPPVGVGDVRFTPVALAIRPLVNPVRGTLKLAVDLPGREALTVDLMDVTGRRIAHREWTALEPGRHTLTFGSLAGHSPGILFVRVRQGNRTGTTRIALLP